MNERNPLSSAVPLPSLASTLASLKYISALPGFLPPISRDGRTLIDGGVSSAWPVEIAIAAGATDVYVLSTATCDTMTRRRGAFAMFERGVDLISDRVVALQRHAVRTTSTAAVFDLPAPPSHVSLVDLSSTQELIDGGHRTTQAWLANHEPTASLLPIVASEVDSFQKSDGDAGSASRHNTRANAPDVGRLLHRSSS